MRRRRAVAEVEPEPVAPPPVTLGGCGQLRSEFPPYQPVDRSAELARMLNIFVIAAEEAVWELQKPKPSAKGAIKLLRQALRAANLDAPALAAGGNPS